MRYTTTLIGYEHRDESSEAGEDDQGKHQSIIESETDNGEGSKREDLVRFILMLTFASGKRVLAIIVSYEGSNTYRCCSLTGIKNPILAFKEKKESSPYMII